MVGMYEFAVLYGLWAHYGARAQPDFVSVHTASEYVQAMNDGVRHVVVANHLNFTEVLKDVGSLTYRDTTVSIRVRFLHTWPMHNCPSLQLPRSCVCAARCAYAKLSALTRAAAALSASVAATEQGIGDK